MCMARSSVGFRKTHLTFHLAAGSEYVQGQVMCRLKERMSDIPPGQWFRKYARACHLLTSGKVLETSCIDVLYISPMTPNARNSTFLPVILSPTLFALFIDDLVIDLKDKGLGIDCENCQITTLLYADDKVIVAPTPSDLQSLIDVLAQWCITWGIRVNVMKTNIVHFRRKMKSKPRCSHTFKYGTQDITYTTEYKYLGFILDEHLCMEPALSHLMKKAHRALALLNHRATCIGGFHFDTYSLLFNQLVSSIIMPYACIWGHKITNKITSLQIQAMRFFLGVGKTCPTAGLFGEMAWVPYRMQVKLQIIKFWHRILSMSNCRIPSLILRWSQQLGVTNWASRTMNMLVDLPITQFSREQFLEEVWDKLIETELLQWQQSVNKIPENSVSGGHIGS